MTQLDRGRAVAHAAALLARLRIRFRATPDVYEHLEHISAVLDAIRAESEFGPELVSENGHDQSWILTAQEAADMAGVNARSISRACDRKRLHGVKHGGIWLITRANLAAWMARRTA